MGNRLHLPDVTLCCVDTRDPELALFALRKSMQKISFGKVLLLGSGLQGRPLDDGVLFQEIQPLKSVDEYSRFMLKHLSAYIDTPFVLVVQWDGYVVHPEMWCDEFLKYDYIGAPWWSKKDPKGVGNGGFSLRSKRLLDALAELDAPTEPEDVAICVSLRPELERRFDVSFAPLSVAQLFSVEYGPYRPAFGFHGMHLFAREMMSTELLSWLSLASPAILRSKHARKLFKELLDVGAWSVASDLLSRQVRVAGWSFDQVALHARLLHRWALAKVCRRT